MRLSKGLNKDKSEPWGLGGGGVLGRGNGKCKGPEAGSEFAAHRAASEGWREGDMGRWNGFQ